MIQVHEWPKSALADATLPSHMGGNCSACRRNRDTEHETAIARARIQDDTLVAAGIVRGARVVLARALGPGGITFAEGYAERRVGRE